MLPPATQLPRYQVQHVNVGILRRTQVPWLNDHIWQGMLWDPPGGAGKWYNLGKVGVRQQTTVHAEKLKFGQNLLNTCCVVSIQEIIRICLQPPNIMKLYAKLV